MKLIRRITCAITRHAEQDGRTPAPLHTNDVTGKVPPVADIVAAARLHEDARQQANAGARLKRQADKILKQVPDGQYGPVTVERFESSRQVPDIDAIRATFAAFGLGDVPMKQCAPSLTLTWAKAVRLADAA